LTIVDAQLHEPAVSMEWEGADLTTRRLVLTELQVGYLRAVGVDKAVLFPIDLDWAVEAAGLFPERFGIVPMVAVGGAFGAIDAAAPDIAERIAQQAANPAVVGLRILRTMPTADGSHGIAPLEAFDGAVAASEEHGLPLFMSTSGDHVTPAHVAKQHPGLTVIVDHLGISQPPTFIRDDPPFKALPGLLSLAQLPNVALKFSGVPTLSLARYPYADLWSSLHQIVDAFGPERLMWGSDISRIYGRAGFDQRLRNGDTDYDGKHTYAEALFYLRETDELTPEQKRLMLGETAERVLRWR
jgi:predicted TIM-barrel fold metal-dependent hydrolase